SLFYSTAPFLFSSSSGLHLHTPDMSDNSSSSSSNSSLHSEPFECSSSTVSLLMGAAINGIKVVLVLPLSIYILYLGLQQWRQQRSTSHCDIFTYHLTVLELIWALGSAIYFCGTSTSLPEMMIVGYCLYSIFFFADSFFHVLTCVDRYLAVVHPITYLGLKNVRGVRIRNISIGCVWLFCIIWGVVTVLLFSHSIIIPLICAAIFSLVVVSFCSISVLCVLIRPGPGEGGRGRERVDQSKQRAFVTVMAIMGVLLMWFGGLLVSYLLEALSLLSHSATCVATIYIHQICQSNSSSSSNSSLHSEHLDCSNFTVFVLSFAAFHVTRAVLVLPLSIFILYLGLQQWRQQHSSTSTSHSDIFTYHVAVMELLWALGSAIYFCGTSTSLPEMMMMGFSLSTITFCGVILLPRPDLCGALHGCCSPHHLPGAEEWPGEGGRGRERVDQSKQRAFVTVMAIMGVLLMWFGGLLVSYALEALSLLSHSATCVVRVSALWGSPSQQFGVTSALSVQSRKTVMLLL
ncbi:hypothetical protein L3Q82_016472, partial [Scortum barcoo]